MPRRRRRPVPPGHVGPQTAAQMKDAKIHDIREDSGAVFRQKSRRHALEIMAAKSELSDRQCEAGLRLHAVHCMTELSPPSAFARGFVDVTPIPGAATAMKADRVTRYNDKARCIPKDCQRVVQHVVIEGRRLRCRRGPLSRDSYQAAEHRAQLRQALDILAEKFGV